MIAHTDKKFYLPNILFIGPMKAGTTWVHEYLSYREDICLPDKTKEVFYFDKFYLKGMNWYSKHFKHYDSNMHRKIVEVAPSLFHNIESPSRVSNDLGRIKLIIIRRDPIKRSWSHFNHVARYETATFSFNDALDKYPEILSASQYEEHIRRWSKINPEIHILNFSDLQKNPKVFVEKLCKAMEIPYAPIPHDLKKAVNKSSRSYNAFAARYARKTSYFLRKYRLYKLINIFKKIGLRNLLYGAETNNKIKILSNSQYKYIRDKYFSD
jgi:hypothetical protein